MKKLVIMLSLILLAVALFTIGVFAQDQNIAKDGTWSTDSGFWAMKLDQLTDGNNETACTAHNQNYYTITVKYDGERSFSKLSFVVNSKGNIYHVADVNELTNRDWWFTVKLYDSEGNITYTSEQLKTLDQTVITLELGASIRASKIEIYSFVASEISNCFWEMEFYGHSCEYSELVSETPAPSCTDTGLKVVKCPICGHTKEEIVPAVGQHTWNEGVITTEPTETTNGVKTYTCTACGATKTEAVQPMGHNWDEGTVIPPTCIDDGCTVYKCTDEGCSASYEADITDALGHAFDEGVVTTHPTLTKEGEKRVSCTRDGCGFSTTQVMPKATMEDSSFVIGLDNIIFVEEYISSGLANENRNWKNLFDGINVNASNSQNKPGGWFGPAKSTLTLVFDEEYYILSIDFHVWSNWNGASIEFFDVEGNKVITYANGGISTTSGEAINIADAVGKPVKSMKITISSAKGAEGVGNCLDFQEFIIKAHKHTAEGETAKYDELIGCVTNGSYKKYCYTCEKEVIVEVAPLGSHDIAASIVYDLGYDRVGTKSESCARCGYSSTSRVQPIFYSYGYSVRENGPAGISHKVEVNVTTLEIYNTIAKSPLEFGMVAAATPNFEVSPLKVVDGTVTSENNKVSFKPFTTTGYVCFEYAITNIPEAAYDTAVVLSPYIFDGEKIIYININSDSGEAFETVSFNSLLSE